MSTTDIPITNEEIILAEEFFLPKGAFFDDGRRAIIKSMDTANIKAAPGSGKTTVLLAKLFILAQRMPLKNGKGICVLTHTNVAVDEIKARLGSRADILFSYPNFFGTFQSFVNRYLAIPYYSQRTNSRSVIIDQSYYDEKIIKHVNFKINGFSLETQKNAQYFLNSNRGLLNRIRLRPANEKGKVVLTDGINGNVINIKRPARSLATRGDFTDIEKENVNKWIQNLKFRLLNDGILNHDDSYYLAEQYINKYEDQLKEAFSNRFKFVFTDEAQDTFSHQSIILDRLFNDQVIKQNFGDPNQSIFDNKNSNQTQNWNPSGESCLSIPQSQRFGRNIAEKIKKICVEENNQMEGSLSVQSLKPHIIMFRRDEISDVLEKFVELIERNNLHLINDHGKANDFKAIGWRGTQTDNPLEKLCISSYFPSYNKKANQKKTLHFNNLLSYIKKVSDDVIEKEGVKVYYDSLLNGIIHFLYLANIKNNTLATSAKYFNKQTLKEYLKERSIEEYMQFNLNLSEWALSIHQSKEQYNLSVYRSIKKYLMNNLDSIWPNIDVSKGKVESFLEDTTPEISESESLFFNNYISPIHPSINIKIDTVHAVKGETHKATLYLETFNYGHDLDKILPFIKGQYDKKKAGQKRIQEALKVAYVGMSRPIHLLCLAMNAEGIDKTDIDDLRQSGWEVVFINNSLQDL